jgi:hypothetical protein
MHPSSQTDSNDYTKPGVFEPIPTPRKHLLGFTRNFIIELADAGLIRLVTVTRPGKRRPLRLVHVPSLIAYIEQEEAVANAALLAQHRQAYAHHHKPEDLLEVVQ